ncbi:MAG TPA: SGNH/GDSL hydrolase family protein, partial [Ktedonobacterales bacterium]|nr:SGNH/GDSL hydrolase family protein [Ktedonobacterales bacterium]
WPSRVAARLPWSRSPLMRHPLAPPLLGRSPAPLLALIAVACLLAGCAAPFGGRPAGGATATPRPSPPGLTYVALGASDAYGIGTDDPDRLNWPSVLAGELGGPVHLVNLGIPGATVADALRAELPVALDAHPAVVTIWLAVNDLANGNDLATYTQQLTALVAALRQGTTARIFVGNLPDLTLLPYFSADDPAALGAEVRTWNAAIAGVCRGEGAHLVDLNVGWQDLADHPEYISSDGLHPSTAGAAIIAATFASAIRAAGTP